MLTRTRNDVDANSGLSSTLCESLTADEDVPFGELYELCDSYAQHLLAPLSFDAEDPGPTTRVLESFSAAAAVVEFGYFDIDFRSEYAATHETTFLSPNPGDLVRVHFFATSPESHRLYDYVAANSEAYLGYMVVRPGETASVGRTLVPPRAPLAELAEGDDLARHVRTLVWEETNLFGVPLRAAGVPFMEQDGQLLRCAHVTAWMAHYSAVLRGTVARRPTADFGDADHSIHSFGRTYPSAGVSDLHLSQMLRRAELPPEYIDFALLITPRELGWNDRIELQYALENAASEEERARIWLIENLTSSVSRYLNSGIPCVLNLEDHSVLICGYLRQRDLIPLDASLPTGASTVSGFLVQDDQNGPFQFWSLAELLKPISKSMVLGEETCDLALTIPLPTGLWLVGKDAEAAAMSVFPDVIANRSGSNSALGEIAKEFASGALPGYSLRSYAATGADFKTEFAVRVGDAAAARVIGHALLPKYVWVVELIDRKLREAGGPSVVGTMVIDGSAVSADPPRVSRGPVPLLVHVLGQISAPSADVYADENWSETNTRPYRSGRWRSNQEGRGSSIQSDQVSLELSRRAFARRAKGR